MPNKRFFTVASPLRVDDAVKLAGAVQVIAGAGDVACVSSPSVDDLSRSVVYVEDKNAVSELAEKEVGLCLTTEALASDLRVTGTVAVTPTPKHGFGLIAEHLYQEINLAPQAAGVSPDAKVAPDAEIHSTAIIAGGAEIAARVMVGPFTVIGPGVVIGERTFIDGHVHVTHAKIGGRCRIGGGVRIGQPGFGFVETDQGLARMPQLGSVEIGDKVEIGANVTIDRGALENTFIGAGTKIDNLVHIGHNVRIGCHCVLVAQTGIAGSVRIGDGVLIGGQTAIADHLVIGDGAQIAGGSGVMRDIPAGERWGGYPARPARAWFREVAMMAKNSRKRKTVGKQ